MTDTTTKVLEVVVDNNKAITSISEYNRLIDEQKQKQKELADAFKSGAMSEADYYKAIAKSKEEVKAYSRSVQELSKEVQNNIKDAQEQEGSLRGLRAQLSNLTKEFDALSRVERNGEAGRAKMEEINRITNELKEAEEETQRFYRNVGNYPDVKPLEQQLGEIRKELAQLKFEGKDNTEEFAALAQQASAMKDALADVEQQINSTASDTKNLDTAVSGLSTVMGGLTLLGPVFAEGSEEGEKFNKILQKMQAVMMVLNTLKTIQNNTQKQGLLYQTAEAAKLKLINVLRARDVKATGAQTAAQKLLNVVMKANPVMLLVAGFAALAGAVALVSKAFSKSSDEIAKQEEAIKSAQEALENNVTIYEETLALLEKTGASSERVLRAQLEGLSQLLQQSREIAKSILDLESDKWFPDWDRVDDALNDMNSKSEELTSHISEAVTLVRYWGAEQTKLTEQLGMSEYQKSIDDVNRLYKEQEALIVTLLHNNRISVEEGGNALMYLRKMRDQEIERLTREDAASLEKTLDETQKKKLQIARKELESLRKVADAELELIKDENDKAIAAENERHKRAIEDLRNRLLTEEDLTLTQRNALNRLIELEEQKHQQTLIDLDKEAQEEKRKADEKALEERIAAANKEVKAMEDAVKLEWENRINEAANKGQQTLQMEIDAAKARMDALQQLEGESDAEFKARQLAAEREYIDAKKALNDYELEVEQAKYDALAGMVGGLSQIMEAFGEENEALAKVSKILALGEIAVSTGKAIAAGVAQAAATGPWPANIAAIGTTVATVLANIATAVSSVKSAKFATGGLVTGPGSSTSDSIPAQLSNGESVMNAKTTSMFGPLLSSLNQAGGGIAFNPGLGGQREGYEFLASAVADGMKRVNLRVGVDEVTRVQNRVADIQEISTIE